jgi:hypothetical protein
VAVVDVIPVHDGELPGVVEKTSRAVRTGCAHDHIVEAIVIEISP